MELPTYTNIWKIEKRLYKLYDFRLPMPLPVGQVAVFVAIAVPYMLILTMAGMPFSHTWVWLYVLPPAVLAWLVTRPVLEGKRLPELVLSQLRYLSEPRTWCRMAPLAEKDEISVAARVWRRTATAAPSVPAWRPAEAAQPEPAAAAEAVATVDRETFAAQPAGATSFDDEVFDQEAFDAEAVAGDTDVAGAAEAKAAAEVVRTEVVRTEVVRTEAAQTEAPPAEDPADVASRPVWPGSPAIHATDVSVPATAAPATAAPATAAPATAAPATAAPAAVRATAGAPGATEPAGALGITEPATSAEAPVTSGTAASTPELAERPASEPAGVQRLASGPQRPAPERQAPKPPWRPGATPGLTVRTDGRTSQPLHLVERALRSSPGGGPASGWHDRVIVVPGGHRPGKPDQVQRDEARARLPLAGPARIVVLGCTAGAGQTVTTLLTGHLLAGLRGEAVAVLDLCAGPGSLTVQARQIPRLLPGRQSEEPRSRPERGLQVVTADEHADEPADAGTLIDAVVARYPVTLADPAAAQVPRALHVADQLVLVAPANPDAAGAVAMTLEWLDGHGHAELARRAVAVLNGVSANSAAYTDKAAAVATGRCRAVVRVPWDSGLSGHGPLGADAVRAYTALAGVLMAGAAAGSPAHSGATGQPGSAGQ